MSGLLSGHLLLWLESGCLVLGANMKHVENKTCLLSGHLLWLESGCLVLGANMKHVENKTCLLSGRLLWLESGCLVLGANMKHVENKTCLLSGRLLWLESGCLVLGDQHEACGEQDLSAVWSSPLVVVWVFGAGCQHEACFLHPGNIV